MQNNKTAFLIAGPNGSGKTTFVHTLLQYSSLLAETTHINPDEILIELGLPETKEGYLAAFAEAEKRTNKAIREGGNLLLETVFSSPDKKALFYRLKREGYFVNMVYICTEDPDINVLNVTERVKKGGHDVPIKKILERYEKSLNNLAAVFTEIDCLILIDNSTLDETPTVLSAFTTGSICFITEAMNEVDWIRRVIPTNSPQSENPEKEQLCRLIQSALETGFVENANKLRLPHMESGGH